MSTAFRQKRVPVAIGGTGGSGTRVVAQLLVEAGFELGPTNHALDNLWFALFLKRPHWYAEADGDAVRRAVDRFARLADPQRAGLKVGDLPVIAAAGFDHLIHRYNRDVGTADKLKLSKSTLLSFFRKTRSRTDSDRWGWKEPNTFLFLEELDEVFDGLRYVHVIRNGLDMAFSSNQNQLYNWGRLFGVRPPASPDALPHASLDYWLESNSYALETADERLGEHHLVVQFEELCTEPRAVIDELMTFVGLDASDEQIEELADIPRLPSSVGRFRDHGLGDFDDEQLEAVEQLGFPIE